MDRTQLWKDLSSNHFFLLNESKGIQKPCDSYGNELKRWKPYGTGFMGYSERMRLANVTGDKTSIPYLPRQYQTKLYTPQQKKFDGYT